MGQRYLEHLEPRTRRQMLQNALEELIRSKDRPFMTRTTITMSPAKKSTKRTLHTWFVRQVGVKNLQLAEAAVRWCGLDRPNGLEWPAASLSSRSCSGSTFFALLLRIHLTIARARSDGDEKNVSPFVGAHLVSFISIHHERSTSSPHSEPAKNEGNPLLYNSYT